MPEEKENELSCLDCGKKLQGKQRKFCCKEHKNRHNHKVLYNYKYSRAYRERSPRNYMVQLRSYKNRNKTLSIEFLLDLYEKQKGLCAISKEVMTYNQGTGRCPTNISIDKIDASLPYNPENVQLVCHRVNIMKTDGSEEELRDWCKKILSE